MDRRESLNIDVKKLKKIFEKSQTIASDLVSEILNIKDWSTKQFIILSNGNIHYFWDKEKGNPTRISHFPTLESLESLDEFTPDKNKIIIYQDVYNQSLMRTLQKLFI